MAIKVVPTKANLIKVKASLAFAQKGYELLDKKRTVLIKEMMELNKGAQGLQNEIEVEFAKSYELLQDAAISMGTEQVYEISKSIVKEKPYDIVFKSVMGVELPQINHIEETLQTEYGMHRSTTIFDETTIEMNYIRDLIYKLAEIESGVYRLALEIKKTQKRANALDKIQIPKYKNIVRTIESILEEKEREDFFRLKKIKSKKEKKVEKSSSLSNSVSEE